MKKIIITLLCVSFMSNCFGMGSYFESLNKKVVSGIAAVGAVVSGLFLYNTYATYKKNREDRAREEWASSLGHGVLVEKHEASMDTSSSSSSSSSSSLCQYSQNSLIEISDENVAQELQKNRTFYLNVAGQEIEGQPTNKCGYMALSNALAVQKLIANNCPLTVERIDAETKKSSLPVKDEEIECYELFELAQKNNVSNLYIVASGLEFRDGMYVAAAQTEDTMGDAVLNAFKHKKAVKGNYLHFISNTGGHWVLATVIKIDDQKPVILFMNTKNSPLTKESRSYIFLQNLWKCIGQ